MSIGVYRIYLGSTWTSPGAVERLVRGFDAIPQFLYRLDRLPDDTTMPATDTLDARRSLTRISMTQSHAMLLLSGPAAVDTGPDTALEIDLARHAFRRRLPVIEIDSARADGICDASHPGADIAVGWDAAAIACAIQQMSEQAGADWRAHSRSLLRQWNVPAHPLPKPANAQPALPVAEITRAYELYRHRRTNRSDQGSSH